MLLNLDHASQLVLYFRVSLRWRYHRACSALLLLAASISSTCELLVLISHLLLRRWTSVVGSALEALGGRVFLSVYRALGILVTCSNHILTSLSNAQELYGKDVSMTIDLTFSCQITRNSNLAYGELTRDQSGNYLDINYALHPGVLPLP